MLTAVALSIAGMSFSAADASRLSRAVTKISQPLQRAAAVVTCSISLCLVGINAEAIHLGIDSDYGAQIKELELGVGYKPDYGYISGKAILGDNTDGYNPENLPSIGLY